MGHGIEEESKNGRMDFWNTEEKKDEGPGSTADQNLRGRSL